MPRYLEDNQKIVMNNFQFLNKNSMEHQQRQIQTLNMPWEDEYGYAQAVKLGSTVWISGQFGHDEKGKLAKGMTTRWCRPIKT
jgi:enamine deaminase RidA (YjgF/YER057c/UK114 family)